MPAEVALTPADMRLVHLVAADHGPGGEVGRERRRDPHRPHWAKCTSSSYARAGGRDPGVGRRAGEGGGDGAAAQRVRDHHEVQVTLQKARPSRRFPLGCPRSPRLSTRRHSRAGPGAGDQRRARAPAARPGPTAHARAAESAGRGLAVLPDIASVSSSSARSATGSTPTVEAGLDRRRDDGSRGSRRPPSPARRRSAAGPRAVASGGGRPEPLPVLRRDEGSRDRLPVRTICSGAAARRLAAAGGRRDRHLAAATGRRLGSLPGRDLPDQAARR